MKIHNLSLILFIVFCFSCLNIEAQISEGGIPPSFILPALIQPDKVFLAAPDKGTIEQELLQTDKDGTIHTIGHSISTNLNMNNSGDWSILKDGRKIWRLTIEAKDALALGVYYDKFYIPKGGKLFLYNSDKTQIIGAYTSNNNLDEGNFSTEPVQGESVTLEYVGPQLPLREPEININELAYFFRDMNFLFQNKNFGDSDASCQVNINCSPEGDNWQDEKRGVARILTKVGSLYGWCSGSLLNNVREDCTPYFLTADHCGGSASPSDFNQWLFFFNFEGSGCENPASEPTYNSMTGATFRARGGNEGTTGSDFLLVELKNNIPDYYNPYYNGWNRSTSPSSSGVCIQHPAGDIKKISTYTSTVSSAQWNGNNVLSHWLTTWSSTANGNGVSEAGSSGSPLFDANGRIVGTLTGGASTCSNTNWPDYFGKMSYHWTSNGVNNADKLRPWLDPDGTGSVILDGTNPPCGSNLPVADFTADITTVLIGGTINFSNLSSSADSYNWTFTGGSPDVSTEANPSVIYSVAGNYTVSLTVTNSNGNDTQTKTGYITVIDQLTTCDTLHYPLNSPTIYYWSGPNSYFSGTNTYNFTYIADRFSGAETVGYDRIEGVWFLLGKISGTTTTVTFNIWTDNAGTPGTVLGTVTKQLSELVPYEYNYITFDPPINFTNSFFGGVSLPYGAQAAAGDTLVVFSDTMDAVIPGTAFAKYGGDWYNYSALSTDNVRLGIFPFVCPFDPAAAPVTNFNGGPRVTFVNEPVDFFDLSLNDPTSWLWTFQNGTPATKNVQNPTGITWGMPGLFDVSLTATNANGSGSSTETDYIDVREHTCEDVITNYSMGFENDEDFFEWEMGDVNSDETTWGFFTGSLGNTGTNYAACYWNNDGVTASNDWLFTKCMSLESGTNYRITFYYRARSATYPQQMKVSIGTDQTAAAMTTLLVDLGSFTNDAYQQSITNFTVPSTGNYYIGFHDYSLANEWATLLDDINIERVENPPVANFTSNHTSVCTGESVSFADLSINGPTFWSWDFAGGTPSASTDQNPTVTYNIAGTYGVSLTSTNSYGTDTKIVSSYITVYNAPTITLTIEDISCNGDSDGSITVDPSGGSVPYLFDWATGESTQELYNLLQGTYTVTITDANACVTVLNGTIIEPAILAVTNDSIINVSCNGGSDGSITANVTGGITPYTYLWTSDETTQTLSGLATDSYTVIVTDGNGCQATATSGISEPSPLITFISEQQNPDCYGGINGSATVSPSGGTQPYYYSWSQGDTFPTEYDLPAGLHTVTVTDANGCESTSSVNLGEPSVVVATIGTVTDATCFSLCDGTSEVSGSGGTAPYTYSWDGGQTPTSSIATGLCAETFTVSVYDDNGCIATTTSSISEPTEIILNTQTTDAHCNQNDGTATVTVAGGIPDYTYLWEDEQTGATAVNLLYGSYGLTVTDLTGCEQTTVAIVNEAVGLSAITTENAADCPGASTGSAFVTVSGGSPTYTYLWSTGSTDTIITDQPAGSYWIEITDQNNCVYIQSVVITEPDAIIIMPDITHALCFGDTGSVILQISGGTSPYSEDWGADDPNSLLAGSYSVTVTDGNGCTEYSDVVINEPSELSVITYMQDVSCFGYCDGVASAIPVGGTLPYTLLWDVYTGSQTTPEVINLCAGSYTVTVTDSNNCEATGLVYILEPEIMQLALMENPIQCNGGTASVTIDISGGTPPYTEDWNSADPDSLPAGTYSFTVSDAAGCLSTSYITVAEPAVLFATLATQNASTINDADGIIWVDVLGGGEPPYSFEWSDGSTTDSVSGLLSGNYCLTLIDVNSCEIIICDSISYGVGISEDGNDFGIYLFPNPTTGTVTIGLTNLKLARYEITDIVGRAIFSENNPGNISSFDLSQQRSGVYYVNFYTSKGLITKQVIKMK